MKFLQYPCASLRFPKRYHCSRNNTESSLNVLLAFFATHRSSGALNNLSDKQKKNLGAWTSGTKEDWRQGRKTRVEERRSNLNPLFLEIRTEVILKGDQIEGNPLALCDFIGSNPGSGAIELFSYEYGHINGSRLEPANEQMGICMLKFFTFAKNA